jgi:hypothetical protein
MTVFTIPKGTTRIFEIPILDRDGAPKDVTGWHARAQVRANRWFPELPVLYEWSTLLSPPNATLSTGQLLLAVGEEESALWTWWAGDCDIELTDPDGQVARLEPYSIVVTPAVTHD